MPVYSLKCSKCDVVYEEFLAMSKRHKYKCPKCGKICTIIITSAPNVNTQQFVGDWLESDKWCRENTISKEENIRRRNNPDWRNTK